MEMGGGDSTGGVVLQSQQGEARPAAFEPVMATSVGQLHQAEAGTALAAGAILARAPFLRRSQPCGAQKAPQAFAGEGKAFLGDELLVQMGIVEAGISGACQVEDALPPVGGKSPRFGEAAVAMRQPIGGAGLKATFKALHLSFAQFQ